MRQHSLQILPLLEFPILVDALLYEYTLQRCEIELFLYLVKFYLQFATQKLSGTLCTVTQKLAHRQEVGLVVADHTAVWRNSHLAVGKGIKRIYGFVAGCPRKQVHHYVGLFGSVVVNLAYLYLTFLESLENGSYDHARSLPIRDLGDGKGLVVDLFDLGTHFNHTATLAVVIAAHIHESAGREVGIERELLPSQTGDGRIYQFIEIMRQDL